jgi:hypothetical protein
MKAIFWDDASQGMKFEFLAFDSLRQSWDVENFNRMSSRF